MVEPGGTCFGEVLEGIAPLLAAGGVDRHDPLDEQAASVALRPEAHPPPHHTVTNLAFGDVMPRPELCRVSLSNPCVFRGVPGRGASGGRHNQRRSRKASSVSVG